LRKLEIFNMTLQEELDELYIGVGENTLKIEEVFDRIQELENLINPPAAIPLITNFECDCNDCWECATRRGGCPEDI